MLCFAVGFFLVFILLLGWIDYPRLFNVRVGEWFVDLGIMVKATDERGLVSPLYVLKSSPHHRAIM